MTSLSAIEVESSSVLQSPTLRALNGIFQLLDNQGKRYAVLHGYEDIEKQAATDLDILIDPEISPGFLYKLLARNQQNLGMRIIRRNGSFYSLAIENLQGSSNFVHLDFTSRLVVDGYEYADAETILDNRVRFQDLWVPSISAQFSGYFLRRILQQRFDQKAETRLKRLIQLDSGACLKEIRENSILNGKTQIMLEEAVIDGNWQPVFESKCQIENQIHGRLNRDSVFSRTAEKWKNRIRRAINPGGFSLVILGQDGAGKSTLINSLLTKNKLPFDEMEVAGFAPALHTIIQKGTKDTSTPHALPPRPFLLSLVKAGYWFVHAVFGQFAIRRKKMGNSLIAFDRHFMDVLVDPIRYRYGGPGVLLGMIYFFTATPDLIVLLDAPAEVLHARKPELEMSERVRQRQAYLDLVSSIPYAITLDATKGADEIEATVVTRIVDAMSDRFSRRV